MIRSISHRGLRKLYQSGQTQYESAGVPTSPIKRQSAKVLRRVSIRKLAGDFSIR